MAYIWNNKKGALDWRFVIIIIVIILFALFYFVSSSDAFSKILKIN